jgi:hypothetical protein
VLVDPGVQFGSYIKVHVSKGWPTCSTLLVNAKEYPGAIHFRRKLLFIWCPGDLFLDSHEMIILPVLSVLAECFYSLLCLFGF